MILVLRGIAGMFLLPGIILCIYTIFSASSRLGNAHSNPEENIKIISDDYIVSNLSPWETDYIYCCRHLEYCAILKIVLPIILILALVSSPTIQGTVDYHNLPLEFDGTYSYLCEIKRSDDNTYLLPAEISIEDGTYYLDRVYFSSGGYLWFEDEELKLDKFVSAYSKAGDGEEVSVKLLNEHTYSPYIEESSHTSAYKITITVIEFLIIIAAIILNILDKKRISLAEERRRKYDAVVLKLRLEKANITEEV